jgi:ATP-dependent RNA helicase DDX18/HAS1
MNLSE